MASEFSKLAGIGGGIISNILWIVAALVVAAGAF